MRTHLHLSHNRQVLAIAWETAGAQALAAGAAASTEAPAASTATAGSRILPAAAVWEPVGAQVLAAEVAAPAAAPAAEAATGVIAFPAAAAGGTAGTQAIAAKASAAQEPEDECDGDSCWLGHGDEGGNSSDGGGDGGIGSLSTCARHPGAHPTVTNGIYIVRDDGG